MQLYTLKSQVEISINKTISLKKTIGLVPTMGSLHHGHLSLIKKAVNSCDLVWVSIFVNPTQFNSKQDLNNYPKNINKRSRNDLRKFQKTLMFLTLKFLKCMKTN